MLPQSKPIRRLNIQIKPRGRLGYHRMEVGFTATNAISAYPH